MHRITSLIIFSCFFFFFQCKNNPESKVAQFGKLYPSEDFFLMKQYPFYQADINEYEQALQQLRHFDQNQSLRNSGEWIVQGPGNLGARANCIAVSPFDTQKILVGFSEGGLFLTDDGGESWSPVFDDKNSLSVGAVAFDPVADGVAYVGTGDPNISGFPFIGDGLYKSIDGGKTWQYSGLRETRTISKIRIAPDNNNVIYVSAMGLPFQPDRHRGVFKSTDGGATWQQVLFIDEQTGVADLVVHPLNGDILYATTWTRIRNHYQSIVGGETCRIYKSTDGGQTWKILTQGLPSDSSSRIGIDISASNPNVLYACYADHKDLNLKGIFKSTDGGETWTDLKVDQSKGLARGVYGGFGWYFGKIRINPNDPNDVFLLAVDLHRSRDGGQTWQLAASEWWNDVVHADKHDLVFSYGNMYLTTDGGAYRADINNENWEDIEDIPATQFYRIAFNPNKPDWYYGGAQDNGTSGGHADIINEWEKLAGGDGFQPVFHPTNPNIYYFETQGGSIYVTATGGQQIDRATEGIEGTDPRNWDTPLIMSHSDPDVLYTGTNRIYRNTTGADVLWTAISPVLTDDKSDFLDHTVTTIDESPLNKNHLMAGTSDGHVWVSSDQGKNWTNVTEGLPSRYVSSVAFSPVRDSTIYVSFTGYKSNDNTPYIFQSDDLGVHWISKQGDMPPVAINNILVLDGDAISQNGVIFIATDAGVYYTRNDGKNWLRLGNNMPYVTVYDVGFNPAFNQIVAGTFGRSIQSFDLSQINYPSTTQVSDVTGLDFSVYPTLISDDQRVTILCQQCKNQQFVLYDINGKVLQLNINITDRGSFLVSQLESGIYFIRPVSKNAKAIKLVKI
ncbi:MAG: T9SS type A sorting domain-containing protein [Saprospiraceae bacterium]|nr:T9SS type A sorting domain-containing protein [Saprospiraceae bacterium]